MLLEALKKKKQKETQKAIWHSRKKETTGTNMRLVISGWQGRGGGRKINCKRAQGNLWDWQKYSTAWFGDADIIMYYKLQNLKNCSKRVNFTVYKLYINKTGLKKETHRKYHYIFSQEHLISISERTQKSLCWTELNSV